MVTKVRGSTAVACSMRRTNNAFTDCNIHKHRSFTLFGCMHFTTRDVMTTDTQGHTTPHHTLPRSQGLYRACRCVPMGAPEGNVPTGSCCHAVYAQRTVRALSMRVL